MSLDGKVVIITGPAAGIGASTAKLFARKRAKLCLLDIDEAGLKRVFQLIQCHGIVRVINPLPPKSL